MKPETKAKLNRAFGVFAHLLQIALNIIAGLKIGDWIKEWLS